MDFVEAAGAVGGYALGLEALHMPTERLGHARQNLGQQVGAHYLGQVRAHHLAGELAVAAGMGGVREAADQVFVVVGQARRDAVGDGLQEAVVGGNALFSGLAIADVDQGGVAVQERALFVVHRGGREQGMEAAAILVQHLDFEWFGLSLLQQGHQPTLDRGAPGRVDQLEDVQPFLHLLAAVAQPAQERLVDVDQAQLRIERQVATGGVVVQRLCAIEGFL
ncbi:hypothetical protein FQZ97_900450 [compost metagenome]